MREVQIGNLERAKVLKTRDQAREENTRVERGEQVGEVMTRNLEVAKVLKRRHQVTKENTRVKTGEKEVLKT